MCMLHSFPHNIHHCLTWARYEFEGLLDKTPAEANAFLSKSEECIATIKSAGDAQARQLLKSVVDCLVSQRCLTFEDCLSWAKIKFEDNDYLLKVEEILKREDISAHYLHSINQQKLLEIVQNELPFNIGKTTFQGCASYFVEYLMTGNKIRLYLCFEDEAYF
jgi:hypothetical protein